MPSLVPDANGVRHDYDVTIKVRFSMVTERGSEASFMTPEQNAEGLAAAYRQHMHETPVAFFTDDYEVDVKATATPAPSREEV